jgi:hypothetical protein
MLCGFIPRNFRRCAPLNQVYPSCQKWYELGAVSQEKAAEIAGMNREDFLLELSKFTVTPFQYSAEEVLREAGYV